VDWRATDISVAADPAATCQQLGLHYVIRIKPDVHVKCRRYTRNLSDLPVKRGLQLLLKDVDFRQEDPVTQHVAVCWKKGLPR
jgi:hypothetical protein